MSTYLKKSSLITALAGLAMPVCASANTDETVEYEIQAGDTLIGLAEKYMRGPRAVQTVIDENGIRNPRRLPIGGELRIPVSILRYKPEPLRVLAVSGPVSITANGQESAPDKGNVIAEGSVIRTGAAGFISLGGASNSRISLPSNSTVRLRGARRYLINDAIDFDVRVLRGRSEVRAPKLKDEEKYRVGTPRAVTAVRGTEFRVAFEETAQRSLTEVTEGEVIVSSGAQTVAAAQGSGVSASLDGLGQAETLLQSPELIEPSKIQTGELVRFTIKPLEQAAAYRTQIARDVGFVEIIAESVSQDLEVTFAEIPDGRLSVRSRGVADSGLEGFSEPTPFRRKRLGATAGVEPSPFADAFKFVWVPEGEGKSFGAFQLWNIANPDALLVDEVGLETNGFFISNLQPGTYKWRIATFQIDEGEVIKVWAPAQDLTITD